MISMPTPLEMRNWLTTLFPSFEEEWEKDEAGITLHSVFQRFTPYFSINAPKMSESQLKKLAAFINDSVEKKTNLENAISTCFLEHLHQIKSDKLLKPYLTKLAKEKMHA